MQYTAANLDAMMNLYRVQAGTIAARRRGYRLWMPTAAVHEGKACVGEIQEWVIEVAQQKQHCATKNTYEWMSGIAGKSLQFRAFEPPMPNGQCCLFCCARHRAAALTHQFFEGAAEGGASPDSRPHWQ